MAKITLKQRLWIYAFIIMVFCCLPYGIHLLRHPDPTKIDAEQYAAFSAYLSGLTMGSQPLSGRCGEFQDILVTEKTISIFARPSMIQAPSTGVFKIDLNEFFIRNMHSSVLDFRHLRMHPDAAPIRVSSASSSQGAQRPELKVSMSKVGFSEDLTQGIFYAELSCGSVNAGGYVYLERDVKHGNRWY